MNKHIWYRLEYKRWVSILTSAVTLLYVSLFAFVTGVCILGNSKPDSDAILIMVSAILISGILIVLCGTVATTLKQVDKHEWELTKIKEGGKTQ